MKNGIGQTPMSNLNETSIHLTSDTSLIASFNIIPKSISIQSSNGLNYNPVQIRGSRMYIQYQGTNDSLNIKYRTFPVNFDVSHAVLDSTKINSDERVIPIETDYRQETLKDRLLISSNKLEYTGSFSRGVSFGNTQDVVLNSNFNLQMRGDLGNGLFLRAAISDENIPIQPEGNTQVLQEFDKVFMEVKKDKTTIVAGDYELPRPDSYFINYYKKLKGISANNSHDINNEWRVYNKGSFAISRGKFRRQQLTVTDGNQGPYKLQGQDGELFLQILSGTEKVFADGVLLKRGETADYIIDYNRGEIRFTPNRIITANLRIIVEFEYAVQSYLRSLYATETKIEKDNLSFGINFYNEQDSKSLSSNIQLDSTDLANLRAEGDNDIFRDGIFEPNPESLGNIILYKKDVNGNLIYAPDDTTQVFGATFSNFGSGLGDYEIDTEAGANGRVYKYVGTNNGSYNPKIPLVAPEKKQIASFNINYKLADSTNIYLETVMSNNDINRFSIIDNDDNVGLGLFAKINDIRAINNNNDIILETFIDYESVQKNFQALNPYRNPEFIRDWNLESTETKNNQQLFNGSVKLKKGDHYLKYKFSNFSDKGIYKGQRNWVEVNTILNDLRINLNGNWLNSTNSLNQETVYFFRPRARISQSLFNDKWTVGAYFEKEKNIRDFILSDSLNVRSFDYELSRVYVENKTSDNLAFRVSASQRKDFEVLPLNNELTPSTTSLNYEFGGTWNTKQSSRLTWQLVLRNFLVEDAFLDLKNASKAFIGNVDHKLQLFKKGVSLNTYYESNSGQEPKIEFQFIKVQIGEGSYIWNDYNQDSIEQINEFEISPFSDQAAYEKITVFNNEFISTNRSILNQTLKVNPKQFIKNKKSFFNNIQLNSRYRIDQKRLSDGDNSIFQFVSFKGDDEGFVAFNASFDHSLFFYRGNPNFDFQVSYRTLKNKLLQISGTDQRTNKSYYTRSRLNIKRRLDLLLETNYGFKSRILEIANNQDFDIKFWNATPQINFRPNSKLRFVLKYKFEKNDNRLGTINEKATFHDGGLDLTWRQNQTSNLQLKFNYVLIDFTGSSNSPIEFEMLQGLKDGQNILWQLNYTRRISSSIDMIINYNGRKSEGNRLVNTAGVQMRAVF